MKSVYGGHLHHLGAVLGEATTDLDPDRGVVTEVHDPQTCERVW